VSLCIIVKNESHNLPACIGSVGDLAGEIIVVDTGSTDDTVAIAQRLGAKVFHFPWIDSFSAARNEDALKLPRPRRSKHQNPQRSTIRFLKPTFSGILTKGPAPGVDLGGVMSDSDNHRLLAAASFAARAHAGQMRKDGRTPYVGHPFRVCLVVRQVFGFDDPRMLIAALLHDTIEDTTTDFDDVDRQFGGEIAQWVAFLTKDKRLHEEPREREYLERLRGAPWQVQVCKLADIYDNLLDSASLAADPRTHSLRRGAQYMEVLGTMAAPEAARPIALVQGLLRDLRPHA
jgi:guanosine-3',5'-bis(diphosphate) 3'-pyrophosphohydrolase